MTLLCNQMEKTGKVDLSINDNIDRAKSELSGLERFLATTKPGIDVKSAFLGYHIVRNVNLVLTKMKDRFEHSKENADNPLVAQDSLLVLPVLNESLEVAIKYGRMKIAEGEEVLMLNHILRLRDITARLNMVLTPEEDAKTIGVSPAVLEEEEQKLSDAVKKRYDGKEDIY